MGVFRLRVLQQRSARVVFASYRCLECTIVANCDDSQNMKDRAERAYPDGARGMSCACHETCSITLSATRVHLNRCHAGMRGMHIVKACMSIVWCIRRQDCPRDSHYSPNTWATAGHVPHAALMCAVVCWMVLAAIRDLTSAKLLASSRADAHYNPGNRRGCVLVKHGCWRFFLMIMPS